MVKDYSRVYDFTQEGDARLFRLLHSNGFVIESIGVVIKNVHYKEIKKGNEVGQIDLFYGRCRLVVLAGENLNENPLEKFVQEYKSNKGSKTQRKQ